MGLFKKKPKDPSEIERLKSEIASMAARLDAADSAKQQLGDQVQGLATRLDTPPEPPPPPPPSEPTVHPDEFRAIVSRVSELAKRVDNPSPVDAPAPAVSPDELEAVNAKVQANTEQLGGLDGVGAQVQTLTTRLDQLDARITSISNELANQITELSSDIESLNGKDPASDLVDRLRDTQVKLANEQARYQIAFREDLAHLADFLKHN
jgi:tetrahydromethanopterin S-methyltransferase subunit G